MTEKYPNANAIEADKQKANARGLYITGFPRQCRKCGGSAYGSPTANWQNRVICLDCGKKWSQ